MTETDKKRPDGTPMPYAEFDERIARIKKLIMAELSGQDMATGISILLGAVGQTAIAVAKQGHASCLLGFMAEELAANVKTLAEIEVETGARDPGEHKHDHETRH